MARKKQKPGHKPSPDKLKNLGEKRYLSHYEITYGPLARP